MRTETEQKIDSFHNQWQVGNFFPQNPVEAGVEVLLTFVLY
jgi:hypothetical protein